MDNIDFIRQTEPAKVAAFISRRLNDISAQEPVLWLVPGGSAAGIASRVSHQLKHPANVIVSLTDERYGPPSHSDSNWQLLKSQAFRFPPRSHQVLNGKSLSTELKSFENFLDENKDLYKTALLGMGADGHIAGILPGSPALSTASWAAGYEGADFTRLSVSRKFITGLDEAFVYAVGAAKRPQIKLLGQNVPVSQQPAQLLKQVPRVYFFNDLKSS